MSFVLPRAYPAFRLDRVWIPAQRALSSHATTTLPSFNHLAESKTTPIAWTSKSSGLHRLSTGQLARSVILAAFFSFPYLFNPGFAVLRLIANSRSPLLNVDSNPILRAIFKPLLYNHFCAGKDFKSIAHTRDGIKKTGYAGVILCYGKELAASQVVKEKDGDAQMLAEIEHWRKGNLETLSMMGDGDWLGIKMTGAGNGVCQALLSNAAIPPAFAVALDQVCQQTARQNCQLWIDSEQAAVQSCIDSWTIDLMRKHNRSDKAVVYNTLQAYLKTSRSKLNRQLALSKKEGWKLAIKLVRGAYMEYDPRETIQDTKAQTDEAYNSIAKDMLSGQNLGIPADDLPPYELFLAGHNPQSIALALQNIRSLRKQSKLKVMPNFGQLQGMGDQVGCEFLEICAEMEKEGGGVAVPKMYKCLTWGTIRECMQYIVRRAVENRGGAERMRDGMWAYWGELKRRGLGKA